MSNSNSIFDIFKIGVGPSSSHTLGPWRAGLSFLDKISPSLKKDKLVNVEISLYGSLSKTGKGHGTDVAIMLGLCNHQPDLIDTSKISDYIEAIRTNKTLPLAGEYNISFDPEEHLLFKNKAMPEHPNTMSIKASFSSGQEIEETYYSIGGGAIVEASKKEQSAEQETKHPYPFKTAKDLIAHIESTGKSIDQIALENEKSTRSEEEIRGKIDLLHKTIKEIVYRGVTTEGTLPGGLRVKRRAKSLAQSLLKGEEHKNIEEWYELIEKHADKDFNNVNSWVSCFALAVCEENAALGRIVTAPTNGAAGIVPTVLMYYRYFCDYKGPESIFKFFLTAGVIGILFKENASISGAMGGCQAETGVSASMSAAGLVAALGGDYHKSLIAAEIAMEHHLGLTCDPVRGLVQVPCIERNAVSSMKAITAANLAMTENRKIQDTVVSLDTIIKTMYQTGLDMKTQYKETAEGGLAALDGELNLSSC